MSLLIFGVALWWIAHLFKRLMPGLRARLGNPGKGLVALGIFVSLVAMVIGYRGAEFSPVYTPIAGMGHANNLLMFFVVMLMGAGHSKGVLASKIRHPMLLGGFLWGCAHLLVNGDLASLILFGGIAVWAVVEIMVLNRVNGAWDRPAPGPIAKDVRLVVMSLVLYGIIAAIHIWLNHNPFLGTYG